MDQIVDGGSLVCHQADPESLVPGNAVHTVELLLPVDGGAQVQGRQPTTEEFGSFLVELLNQESDLYGCVLHIVY